MERTLDFIGVKPYIILAWYDPEISKVKPPSTCTGGIKSILGILGYYFLFFSVL
jgi:hypothetical protein